MRRWAEIAGWMCLGALVGSVACGDPGYVVELCVPMTLSAIPTGTFPTMGAPPAMDGGTIDVTDAEVRLSFEHEEWGHVEAAYERVGEVECGVFPPSPRALAELCGG